MSSEEPLTVPCAANPDVQTTLRCGRCETPICPRCLVSTPVGARCRSCAQVKRLALVARPGELARSAGLGLGAAVVGFYLLELLPLGGLFFRLLGFALLGFVVGEASREYRAGSAGSPAANIVALGSRATIVGVLGQDAEGEQVGANLAELGIDREGLVRPAGARTAVKTRFLAQGFTGGLHGR